MTDYLLKNKFSFFFSLFNVLLLSCAEASEAYVPPPSSSYSLIRVILSLIIVFLMFYGVIFLFKFFLLKKGLLFNKKQLKILDVSHPGNNLSLYLVESQGKNLLIAANGNHIALLQSSEKTPEELPEIPKKEDKGVEPQYSFKSLLSRVGINEGGEYED